ncbi:iron-regulated protein [Chondromyces crocatus]|uniref:Iron-regulated protein n=2 Tax=Chondromyces crocatus TaxID=52 RepID=A0A0K1EFQ5_CHOCO|nr:iron-regulated protein [Chondromyces crocatus]
MNIDFSAPFRTAASWGRGLRVLLPAAALLVGCGGDDDGNTQPTDDFEEKAAPVVARYAELVHKNYSDALDGVVAIRSSLATLVQTPTAANLAAARSTWLEARNPYGLTEAYRFYFGPIDNDEGPEGQINAWPMDESYVDYVVELPDSGIINDPGMHPTLGTEALAALNEVGGEENVATGYHAIEFLLWGQDLSDTGPGDRPHTDYIDGPDGTAANQTRRGEYLLAAGDLLFEDLEGVTNEWAAGAENYRATFESRSKRDSVRDILLGIGSLSGAELAGERMQVAYDTKEEEDEHSCFSDNTHNDILYNALGIQNVYLGRIGTTDGPGIDDLVEARNPELNKKLKEQLEASITAIKAIPVPFDQAILGADTDPGRVAVKAAIDALRAQTQSIVEVADLLGVELNLEE